MDAVGIDVTHLWGRKTMFGFENTDWKEWRLFDGTPVLVPGWIQHHSGAERRHTSVSGGGQIAGPERENAERRILRRCDRQTAAHR